ncbi:hypothetical protein [Dyadobacter psychrotolerans]|uniref:Uncharacterized protein n=1 Tax=Dyadobacter psychrotolerans TaxID=2541721 RepID=A0A4R5DG12_9BACT|nr:hypothetical protein [Dyadobacter psychrotolerans]TDE10841.1 hypothetical protein E0F88_27600 [Dyadobacter psychrotolerans]
MLNPLNRIVSAMLDRWPHSRIIKHGNLPYTAAFPVSKMIIDKKNLWFISFLTPGIGLLKVIYCQLSRADQLSRSNFLSDENQPDPLLKFNTKTLFVHYLPEADSYKVEFFNDKNELIATDAGGLDELIYYIECAFGGVQI